MPQAAPQAKKLFLQAAPQARRLLPYHRQEGFCRTTGKRGSAAPQTRRLLPHHRQEGFCHTTGKRDFATPQARGLLPHHRQEGFCRTTDKKVLPHDRQKGFCRTSGEMILVASQRANNILAAPDKSMFSSHRYQKGRTTIGKVNLQILPKIKTGLVSLETELALPGYQFLTTV